MPRHVIWAPAIITALVMSCANGEDLFVGDTSGDASTNGGASGGTSAQGGSAPGPSAGGGGSTSSQMPVCSTDQTPDDICDPSCSSCDNGNCRIQCNEPNGSCSGDSIDCPEGMTCNVVCSERGCQNTVVNCVAPFQCNVICQGDQACRDLTMNCAPGAVCKLLCQDGNDVCRDTKAVCDNNWCITECTGDVDPLPSINCDATNGCPCTTCG